MIAGFGIRCLIIRGDLQLVVNQAKKDYDCLLMAAYVAEVNNMERHFDGLQLEHIPYSANKIADDLLKLAACKERVPLDTFIERLTKPSVHPAQRKGEERVSPKRSLADMPLKGTSAPREPHARSTPLPRTPASEVPDYPEHPDQ